MLTTKQTYKIGDCLDLLQEIEDNSIDMVLTSPPYDNLRTYGGYNFDFEPTAKELYRVVKKGGVVVWIVGDQTIKGSESGTSFRQALYFKEIGFNLHDTMIYQKQNPVPLTHNRYEQAFEYMFVLSKGKPKTFNPIKVACKNAGKLEKYGVNRRLNHGDTHSMRNYDTNQYIPTKPTKITTNIFTYIVGTEKTKHPAAFPEQLAHDHIISWSNECDTVLDPFVGSGTTLKMCKILNRNGIGFDSNPEYEPIIKQRLDNKRCREDDRR